MDIDIYKTALHIIDEGFKSAGISGDEPFKVLKGGLGAMKPGTPSAYQKATGERVDDEPDWNVRHKYMMTAMELKKLIGQKVEEVKETTVTHKMAPEDIDRLEAISKELKVLDERYRVESVQRGRVIDVTPMGGSSGQASDGLK